MERTEIAIALDDLPDTMYFGAPRWVGELKNRVFLTPYMGIASLFIIDKNDLLAFAGNCSFNLGYRQWYCPNDQLKEPLKVVNMIHNIKELENEVFTGRSCGYIYEVDIHNVKDKLSQFVTNDPGREVIYTGEEPLPIVKCTPHSLRWDFRFDPEEAGKHGPALKNS